jgi:predicted transcriptional regulator
MLIANFVLLKILFSVFHLHKGCIVSHFCMFSTSRVVLGKALKASVSRSGLLARGRVQQSVGSYIASRELMLSFCKPQRGFCVSIDSQTKVDKMNATKERTEADDGAETGSSLRPKLRVSDILEQMPQKNFTIKSTSSVLDAISHLISEKLASALVVDSLGEIIGIFTARDILKCIEQHNLATEHNRQRRSDFLSETSIRQLITPRDQLVYCSPSDSSRRCLEIMFQCKIRNLPVIENGEVKGIITAKLLVDASFNLKDSGGKKGFIHNVTGRKGLPAGTRAISLKSSTNNAGGCATEEGDQHSVCLDMDVASFALPHPFKRKEGVAMSRRLYGAEDLSTDLTLCEDAHFALKVADPLAEVAAASQAEAERSSGSGSVPAYADAVGEVAAPAPVGLGSSYFGSEADPSPPGTAHIYLCVADGVGSWRQYGVDPRLYSHRLVENARAIIEADLHHRALIKHSPFERGGFTKKICFLCMLVGFIFLFSHLLLF